MNIQHIHLDSQSYPQCLRNIAYAPKSIYVQGAGLSKLLYTPSIAIVGSRQISPYGKQVTRQLARDLAGQGLIIVSGLAIGVDGLAHEAALEAGGTCVAVLPTALDRIAPHSNRRLAERIIDNGGALVSEYEPGEVPVKKNFVARNRIVAGLARVVLITEAAEKSGSLHTPRYALQQNKTVMAVPGNITSHVSVGTNNLIKTGAGVVTSYQDVLHELELVSHLTPIRHVKGRNKQEQTVLDLLVKGVNDGERLLEESGLTVVDFNRVLTMLEIGSKIRPLGGNQWSIY